MPTGPDLLLPPDWLRWTLSAAYLGLVALIGLYGLHRYHLVWLFRRHRHDGRGPGHEHRYADLPRVTVQLPMFNERAVALRAIDAACKLDYPADRLQIQVLDDSTDGTQHLTARRVAHWRNLGVDIVHHHRTDRTGFKAGALEAGLRTATGELVAVFDADFVPPPSFLKRTVHRFTDPAVGMVQTRWSHLNRTDSMLTRGQAIFLDGHFVIEHTARHRSGAWINFNGTAGLWRRTTIADAGGWQHDTLTEDVDLSYRAQLRGWKFVFLPHVACPAELPPEINAFKSQQHRWTKGSIQTALKLLPAILRSPAPLKVKVEAFFHLTSPMVYLYVTLFALLFYPAIAVNLQPAGRGTWLGVLIGLLLFAVGTASAAIFYAASQAAQRRSVFKTLLQVPALMSLGVGIALYNAIACLEALFGHESEFVRTPKYHRGSAPEPSAPSDEAPETVLEPALVRPRLWPKLRMRTAVVVLELAMGVYMLICLRAAALSEATFVSIPFLIMFATGYLYVGVHSARLHLRDFVQSRRPTLAPA
jgi:cellulose synthase/poly-beta-1,6-N-acetylglucosamine synthase-like glycosyltransferase